MTDRYSFSLLDFGTRAEAALEAAQPEDRLEVAVATDGGGGGKPVYAPANVQGRRLAVALRRSPVTVLHGGSASERSAVLDAVLPLLGRRQLDQPAPLHEGRTLPFPINRSSACPRGTDEPTEVVVWLDDWYDAPLASLASVVTQACRLVPAAAPAGHAKPADLLVLLLLDGFDRFLALDPQRADVAAFRADLAASLRDDLFGPELTMPLDAAHHVTAGLHLLLVVDDATRPWVTALGRELPGFGEQVLKVDPLPPAAAPATEPGPPSLAQALKQMHPEPRPEASPPNAPVSQADWLASIQQAIVRVASQARSGSVAPDGLEVSRVALESIAGEAPLDPAVVPATPLHDPPASPEVDTALPGFEPAVHQPPVIDTAPADAAIPDAVELAIPDVAATAVPVAVPIAAPVAAPVTTLVAAAVAASIPATEPPPELPQPSTAAHGIVPSRRNQSRLAAALSLAALLGAGVLGWTLWHLPPDPVLMAAAPTVPVPAAVRAPDPATPPAARTPQQQLDSAPPAAGMPLPSKVAPSLPATMTRTVTPTTALVAALQPLPVADLREAGVDAAARLAGVQQPTLALLRYDALQALPQPSGRAPLALVAPLFIEPVHAWVRADSPLRYLHQLEGRRLDIGQSGGGSAWTLRNVYRTLFGSGLPAANTRHDDTASALQVLQRGEVDAVLRVGTETSAPTLLTPGFRALILQANVASTRRALRRYLPVDAGPGRADVPEGRTLGVMSFLAVQARDAVAANRLAGEAMRKLCASLPQLRATGNAAWQAVDPAQSLPASRPYASAALQAGADCAAQPEGALAGAGAAARSTLAATVPARR